MKPLTGQEANKDYGFELSKVRTIQKNILNRYSSMAAWAEARGFNRTLVYKVLHEERKALRGQSKQISDALTNELKTHKK
jgi:gp16 family phage-associated protein